MTHAKTTYFIEEDFQVDIEEAVTRIVQNSFITGDSLPSLLEDVNGDDFIDEPLCYKLTATENKEGCISLTIEPVKLRRKTILLEE